MKICLNMIVKDEAPRIERCLASIADQIDTWAILDTGSTDDTVDRIYNFFEPRKIPGTLGHSKFINFSYTRNEAIALAHTHRSQFDYLLLVDADMELVGEIPQVEAAVCHMMQKGDGLTYWNTRLVRSDVNCRYVGVTHEYLDTPTVTAEKLHGPWFLDHADGGNRPGKIERDINLLQSDVEQHPDNARSWYYLGQSLREAGLPRQAILAYNERIKLGGWDEEVFHAQLSMARCYRDMNAEEDESTTSTFIRHAVTAYQMRPSRAEPLHDLARHYREKGANTASLLFALAGREIPKPDDLLFVEDYPYDWGFKEEISICGFYSKAHREAAHDACEELATSRVAPAALREQSWSNLFHYTRPLSELAPSFATKKIEFEPPDGYRPMNPSITRLGDRMFMNIRTVNYLIGNDGRYQFEGPIQTHNFLCEVSDDLAIVKPRFLAMPLDFPCKWPEVLGLEDVRLFSNRGELWCSATARQQSAQGLCEMITAQIGAGNQFFDWKLMKSPEGRNEKNWIPVGTDSSVLSPFFIYSCDPSVIIDWYGTITSKTEPPVDLRYCSGSTQAIPFDGGYLTMIHERQAHLDSMHGQRNYQQRFLWLDDELKIRKISRRFMLGSGQGEFPCGMCMHTDGERLVISYGILDREAWLGAVDADEVGQMLRDVGAPTPISALRSLHKTHDKAIQAMFDAPEVAPETEPVVMFVNPNVKPFVQFGPIPPVGAFADEISAVTKRAFPRNIVKPAYNSVLKSEDEVRCTIQTAESYGWPIHPDFAKNWDVILAVNAALEHTDNFDAWIIDAGADRRSTFLPTLRQAGYKSLWGINLREPIRSLENGIMWWPGNIEDIDFPPQSLAFIACLSTIEHGVFVPKFLASAARCLKPGGHLFVSTDFWVDPVATPLNDWWIFTPGDIMTLVTTANQLGLSTTSNVNLVSGDRVAHHAGLEYTFINLLFRRDG